ncbi:phosphotransferase [Stakelama tenebrarum]|uniref:Phosphotransferase n=1 Tax=Stakelama tenebrarum TaxID=2711215 RepID=A0A6G6Y8C9_9SPHN|nr:phosphotransferase [Sphingosinithalassobacter tenebrarum]QIG81057.1 phosphotransferase [Sphingosinithalassobacter tenebrarum]
MSDAADSFSGTREVREAHRFDEARLAEWMAANVEGYAGPLTVTQFKGGQSNPTYRLDTPGRAYVLRRKPPGQLLKGAHAVEREARVMAALGAQGFPVPHIFGLCTDEAVIGTWFFVMELVEGRIFWDSTFPDVPREERAAYFDAMNAALAQLHGFDPDAANLGDYGRKGQYLERQIARWSRQYREDEAAGRIDAMDRLAEWLPEHLPPEQETRVIHGDFRTDNMIFHPGEPRVLAVLDWELSTLGDPLADFAYHLMMYRLPSHMVAGIAGNDLTALGLPSEADYVAAYCRRTGRENIPALDFYLAFNMFRFAAILHGIKGRMIRGTAASADAERMVATLPELAEIGWRQAGE